MANKLILSWRSLLMLSLSTDSAKLLWLAELTKRGAVLVSQCSVIKANMHYSRMRDQLSMSPSVSFEHFLRSRISPALVIGSGDTSRDLMGELVAANNGEENLELFAIAAAIQNNYLYQCWSMEERASWESISSHLRFAVEFIGDD